MTAAWPKPRTGVCMVCGRRGRVVAHHIVQRQTVERAGGNPNDPRNLLWLDAPYAMGGPPMNNCHDRHHNYGVNDTRLSWDTVPFAAREFATEVLGEGPAIEYFRRRYRFAP